MRERLTNERHEESFMSYLPVKLKVLVNFTAALLSFHYANAIVKCLTKIGLRDAYRGIRTCRKSCVSAQLVVAASW